MPCTLRNDPAPMVQSAQVWPTAVSAVGLRLGHRVRMGRVSKLLARLDHFVLDRKYGTVWLLMGSACGLVLAVVGAWGFIRGTGAGSTAEPFAMGIFLMSLSLYEIWSRRQTGRGRVPFERLLRLDDQLLRRRPPER